VLAPWGERQGTVFLLIFLLQVVLPGLVLPDNVHNANYSDDRHWLEEDSEAGSRASSLLSQLDEELLRGMAAGHDPHASKVYSNNGIALESFPPKVIWILLLLPYIVLAIALSIDLERGLRITSTHFNGLADECPLDSSLGNCVATVSENYTTFFSDPFYLPLTASFLTLDSQYKGDLSLLPDLADITHTKRLTNLTGDSLSKTPSAHQRFLVSSNGTTLDDDGEEEPPVPDTHVLLSGRLEVYGTDEGWQTLYRTSNDVDLTRTCNLKTRSCEKIKLMTVMFNRPGIARGFPKYRVAVVLEGPKTDQIMEGLVFQVKHDRYFYMVFVNVIRAMLLVATLIGK